MKFGKEFKKQKVPEWIEAYVDYTGLKRWCRACSTQLVRTDSQYPGFTPTRVQLPCYEDSKENVRKCQLPITQEHASLEGISNYFKSLMLILCYLIVAASFFVHIDNKSAWTCKIATGKDTSISLMKINGRATGICQNGWHTLDQLGVADYRRGMVAGIKRVAAAKSSVVVTEALLAAAHDSPSRSSNDWFPWLQAWISYPELTKMQWKEEHRLRRQYEVEGRDVLPSEDSELLDSYVITPGNQFIIACSEVREFEYAQKPSTIAAANATCSEDEFGLLIRLSKLLSSGAEMNWSGCSVLLYEAHEGCQGLRVLDERQQGIIHLAAALGYEWAISPVVATGMSPNFRDAHGRTALHWASFYGSGQTSADLASFNGHKEIAGYLAEEDLTSHPSALSGKHRMVPEVERRNRSHLQ
ncbi:hypothetical protein CTI12_AA264700 [Artemisia annua]|uniref:SPX domain-containing protein n=1 Tax=Artemisia annua TaxID=35608 RepID=A0A2U1NH37_ARTAN|nr:hypothetical protein CTI12_AA264700 [Artemisia annua]